MPIDCFHLNKIYQSFERLFCTDRNNNRTRISPQNRFHLAHYIKEVSTRTVHFIHVCNTWYIIFISLTPYSFRLRLHTTYCTVSSYSAVKYTQRTLYFSSKVNVSRSINQVDFIRITSIFPSCSCSSRCNSDTTFLLLSHPVHCSSTIMNLTYFVSQSGIEQDTFRSSSFSGIDVSHDTDITS